MKKQIVFLVLGWLAPVGFVQGAVLKTDRKVLQKGRFHVVTQETQGTVTLTSSCGHKITLKHYKDTDGCFSQRDREMCGLASEYLVSGASLCACAYCLSQYDPKEEVCRNVRTQSSIPVKSGLLAIPVGVLLNAFAGWKTQKVCEERGCGQCGLSAAVGAIGLGFCLGAVAPVEAGCCPPREEDLHEHRD